MTSNIELNIDNLRESRVPLYLLYSGQYNPQKAYVRMNENGVICAVVQEENGVTFDECYKRTLQWPVYPNIDGEALADILESEEAQALLKKIHQGHTVNWHGSERLGQLSDELCFISDKFANLLEDCETVEIIDNESIIMGIGITDWSCRKSLDEIVQEHIEIIEMHGHHYNDDPDGIREYYLDIVEKAMQEEEWEMLCKVHLDTLLAVKRIDQDEYDAALAEVSALDEAE